ncbi:hypothetical protein MPTK1_3g09040 [Marchantia polymorpha subsp. ruderalis]|uniref:Glycosyl hydrolase family 13 catalytic domain-containing protein n=2 Tax=Marchantia polymorpha TaxID=3197 RepID=A0AAF6AYW5_MARPO|nr:hypothetical protein MARPO_0105s0013 [Marchantia polymorpha]BBN04949.1 hypothetical protein Mp_3g09040 [Marchantia polymorpha subsp. ruderalis]|eukprot:PTQ31894.1 hypothetical protein MARPO_0105s0013 [Marchantia polymorpha]
MNSSVMQIVGSIRGSPWTIQRQVHCKSGSPARSISGDGGRTAAARNFASKDSEAYGVHCKLASITKAPQKSGRNLQQNRINNAKKSSEELIGGHSSQAYNVDSMRKTDKRPSWKDLIKSEDKSMDGKQTVSPSSTELLKTGKVAKKSNLPMLEPERSKIFLYHIDGGGQVVATVTKTTPKIYSLSVQLDMGKQEPVLLHWGLFRSSSTDWVLLDPKDAPPGTKYTKGKTEAMRTPMECDSRGIRTLELDFDASKTPFYVAFVLFRPAQNGGEATWIRSAHGENFCIPVGIGKGQPEPLGLTWKKDGLVNFSLYSKNARNVILCLYKDDSTQPCMEIDLERSVHRTGDVWHAEVEVGEFTRYGYRCKGDVSWESGNRYQARHVLLDPYAKLLAPPVPGQESLPSPARALGSLKRQTVQFDWESDAYPRIPLERLVVYKLNVASFTSDESSGLEESVRGTFEGIARKVQHLVDLGVNAVILESVFEHDDCRLNPISFFAPAARYGSGDCLSASTSLKKMVKELHSHGIEVILDVVYSHTAEGGDDTPKNISFRGIDNSTFYILDGFGKVVASEFGTSNAFNCNHPVVQRMIVDSLRHWVEEYHVDGFVFVNGSALVTGPHGQQLSRPVLVEAISFDPVLASTKLIVDTFSPFTRSSKSLPFPHWRRWCELNSLFRNDARRFLRGDIGELSSFATRLCGSGDIFANGRGPSYSMNFVTGPYGFTLADLVSFSESSGSSTEFSWNCGAEGPTEDPLVLETRVKQVRNFIMALLLSEGVPVFNMGDEYGHSKGGQIDLEESSSQFFWSYLGTDFGQQITRLMKSLTDFRSRRKDIFQRSSYAVPGSITWHGSDSQEPHWEIHKSSFLGARFIADKQEGVGGLEVADLFIAFNPHGDAVLATFPECSTGMTWYRIADTSLPHPDDFVLEGVPINTQISTSLGGTYEVQPYSSVLFEARQRSIMPKGRSTLKFPAAAPSKQL